MVPEPSSGGPAARQQPRGGRGEHLPSEPERLRKQVERQARRMKRAEEERPDLVAQTIYLGTLGLLFVTPVIAGAYLGHWLDTLASGYSARWTVSLLLAGVFVGLLNVYLFLRE